MEIGLANLDDADLRDLLTVHQRRMVESSPPGTSFALDLTGLAHPDVSLFAARRDGKLLGAAALKQIEPRSGEIKSMRVVDRDLGTGVGFALLSHLIGVARDRDYRTLMLETGTGQGFAAANALYSRNGFVRRGPFADYAASDFNIFYERAL